MAVERTRSDRVPEIEGPALSNCKRVGPHVYISGMVAWDGNQIPLGGNSAYEQAKIVFGYIEALMEAAGGTIDDVMKIVMYTTDMRYQPDIWKARAEYFSGDFPTSTLVEVASLFKPEFVIEIDALGYIE